MLCGKIDVLSLPKRNGLLGEELRVGSNVGDISAGFAAQPFDGGQSMRDGIVLITGAHVADRKQPLGRGLRSERRPARQQ